MHAILALALVVGLFVGFLAGMFTARHFFRECQYKAWVDAFRLNDGKTAQLLKADRKKYPPIDLKP